MQFKQKTQSSSNKINDSSKIILNTKIRVRNKYLSPHTNIITSVATKKAKGEH